MKIKEDRKYLIAGIFFLLIEILIVIRDISVNTHLFFWFCDSAPFFLAIGFFIKNKQLVKGIINVGFIAQNYFVVVAFLVLVFNVRNLGFTNLIGVGRFNLAVSFFIHIFSINTALFLTYKDKPKSASLMYAFAYLVMLFAATLAFTSPSENINFIFSASLPGYSIPYVVYLWLPLSILVLVLPNYLIQYLLFLWAGKKNLSTRPSF